MITSLARKLVAALVVGASALAPAQAATVIVSDDFDVASQPPLDSTPINWTTADGTVDWIRDNNYSIRCYGNTGGCVDLDGTAGGPGLMSRGNFVLQAGVQYTLSALVSGNQRNDDLESLTFGFRDAFTDLVLDSESIINILGGNTNNAFNLVSLVFTPTSNVSARIFFQAGGTLNDNLGPILDNVRLTAVPLPAAAWLLLTGLIGFGALGRRKIAV